MSAFTAPSTGEGSSVKPADLEGHLLIITPVEYKTGIQTSLGEAEAIDVDVIDLDTNTSHSSVLFFNVALRNSLRPNIGKQVLARIGKGVAKPGKSAPWILLDATTNAADVEKATKYLAGQNGTTGGTPQATPEVTPEMLAILSQLGAKPF